ncbi:MAG: PadR family transcriptional regulator [Bacillota bacterium]
MEFVILGFLMIRNLTHYELKNVLQQKVSPFFSASLGSIQAELKKLEINGHVEFNEVVKNGRRKKIYAINDLGRQYFLDWMLTSIAPNQLEQDAATRLLFLGLMSSSDLLAVNQEEIIKQLESTVQDWFRNLFTEMEANLDG